MYSRIGESPQRVLNTGDRGHDREESVLGNGLGVEVSETPSALEVPLAKVPTSFEWEFGFGHAKLSCRNGAECCRIVTADTVEVNAENEWLHRPRR